MNWQYSLAFIATIWLCIIFVDHSLPPSSIYFLCWFVLGFGFTYVKAFFFSQMVRSLWQWFSESHLFFFKPHIQCCKWTEIDDNLHVNEYERTIKTLLLWHAWTKDFGNQVFYRSWGWLLNQNFIEIEYFSFRFYILWRCCRCVTKAIRVFDLGLKLTCVETLVLREVKCPSISKIIMLSVSAQITAR